MNWTLAMTLAISLAGATAVGATEYFLSPAGDDAAAKVQVAQLIESLGLDVTDVGPLFNARFVEAMAPVYVYMNFFARPSGGFEYAFSQK